MKPEYRLRPLPVGAVLLPVGLFIYGWTAEYHTHWIAPVSNSIFPASSPCTGRNITTGANCTKDYRHGRDGGCQHHYLHGTQSCAGRHIYYLCSIGTGCEYSRTICCGGCPSCKCDSNTLSENSPLTSLQAWRSPNVPDPWHGLGKQLARIHCRRHDTCFDPDSSVRRVFAYQIPR